MEELEIDVHPDAINKAYLPYLLKSDRFRLYWGGRDGSKSDFVALDLLLQCMSAEYFKFILIRKVFDTIKDSQVATLKKVAEREGISQYFFFGTSPLEVRCLLNKNKFICRGMDNPDKLKSISDPTGAWYEEANQITEEEHNVVSTSLRTSYNVPIQEVFTFNPDHEGNYKDFWLYRKFFINTGHENDLTFDGTIDIDLDGELLSMPYHVLHTTYRDNRWCPPDRRALYESYRLTDEYRYKVWALGHWATRQTGAEFYSSFKRYTHVGHYPYLEEHPIIHLTYDFNALPYMTQLAFQVIYDYEQQVTEVRFFKEYCLGSPDNTARKVAKAFRRDFEGTGVSVYYYGDASGKNRIPSKGDERQFDDIEEELFEGGFIHNDSDKVIKRNPNPLKARDFINELLDENKHPARIRIDESCTELIDDMEQCKLSLEGKQKPRIKDKVKGISYEERGHTSDALTYALWEVFSYIRS